MLRLTKWLNFIGTETGGTFCYRSILKFTRQVENFPQKGKLHKKKRPIIWNIGTPPFCPYKFFHFSQFVVFSTENDTFLFLFLLPFAFHFLYLVFSKFYSGRNQEQIEVRECLLPLGAEPFVFQFVIQKFKDQDIQNYNSACCFVWMWNLVAHIEGGTQAEGVWEQGVEEKIWA